MQAILPIRSLDINLSVVRLFHAVLVPMGYERDDHFNDLSRYLIIGRPVSNGPVLTSGGHDSNGQRFFSRMSQDLSWDDMTVACGVTVEPTRDSSMSVFMKLLTEAMDR